MALNRLRETFRARAVWIALTAVAFAVLASGMSWGSLQEGPRAAARALFAPGPLSHGHAQFGLQCVACHGDKPMAGKEAMQKKCVACHARNDENKAENAHPRAKFEDPAKAAKLAIIDAAHCVTCHGEHLQPNLDGVTQPADFCVACHKNIGKKVPSHQDLAPTSCRDAGCHSYHDNRSTYRSLLKRSIGLGDPSPRAVPARDFAARAAEFGVREDPHATGAKPGACKTCHEAEVDSFSMGKHGVREAQGLSPMSPGKSSLPMKHDASAKTLSCDTCHDAARLKDRRAAVEVCESCHDDTHTRAYEASPHAKAWRREVAGTAPAGSGVSCATCHMPRVVTAARGTVVVHNNSENLHPAIKQGRVCTACHRLQFTLDALADKKLISNNFAGQPSSHVASIDMEARRNQLSHHKEQ